MNTDFLQIQNKKILKKLTNSLTKNIKKSDFILGENVKILEKNSLSLWAQNIVAQFQVGQMHY